MIPAATYKHKTDVSNTRHFKKSELGRGLRSLDNTTNTNNRELNINN